VLTVKTDKGEFILDNQNENVVAWTETGYRFVKRQSQSDPNVWVSLGDNRPAVATASFSRSLTHKEFKNRDPVTSPPLPVPDRLARGQPSPNGCRTFLWGAQIALT